MMRDSLGDFRDWSAVLDRIEMLRQKDDLDSHQDELVRVLCYHDNWRLREGALTGAKSVRCPSAKLLQAVLDIMTDESVCYDARILAAEVLAVLAEPGCGRSAAEAERVQAKMSELAAAPGPPFFLRAIAGAQDTLKKACRTAREN